MTKKKQAALLAYKQNLIQFIYLSLKIIRNDVK